MASVTGATKSTVVTLSRNAEKTAVTSDSIIMMPAGLAFTHCALLIATYWNTPDFRVIATMIIIPVEQADGVPVDGLGRGRVLAHQPDQDDEARRPGAR